MRTHYSQAKWSRCVFMFLALGVLISTAHAAKWKRVTQQTPLKLGQRVQVNWHGDWADGKIVEFDEHWGNIKVRFRTPGRGSHEMTWSFKRSDLRVRAKSSRSSKSSSKKNPFAIGSGNPFEPDKGFRTWKDDTGEFEIEAELVKITSDAVRLKRRDGRMVTVPIDRLCEEDRRFIKRLQGKGDEDDAEDDDEDNNKEEDDGEEEFVDQLPLREAKLEGATGVYFYEDADPSELKPDGGTKATSMTRRTIILPPKEDYFDAARGLYVAAEAPNQIMVPFWKTNQHDQPTRLVLCNLSRGKHRPRSIRFPVNVKAVALGPSAKQVLSCANGFGFGKQARLDLWNIEGRKLVHQFGWKPYPAKKHGHDDNVRWATFIDANHVLTLGENEKLVLWKLPEVEAVYSMTIARGSRPALSPGRKHLAVLTDTELGILNAKTGDVLGCYQGADKKGRLAFRPDGRRLALLSTNRLAIWDLNNSKPSRDIGIHVPSNHQSELAWPSKNYILVSNRYLVDLEKYLVLWDYRDCNFAKSISRQFWCLCYQGNNATLVPQSLPHKNAVDMAKRLKSNDIRGIEPGTAVSLEIQVKAPHNQQTQIRELYENQLKSRGMKIASNQPIKLIVRTRTGKTEKQEYEKSRGFFPPSPFRRGSGQGEVIHFQTQISEVAFMIDGKVAWETSYVVHAPGSIPLEEGESMAQAVRKHQKPNLDFFQEIQIPSYVTRPRKDLSFGASKLTPRGLQPAAVQSTEPKKQNHPGNRRV